MSKSMTRISLISFLSLILITGFSFKANTNVSENNEFFYSMNTVSLVYAGDDVEGQQDGENEGQQDDPLNCDEGEHEENGECVEDSPPPLNCDEGEHEENGECVEDSPPPSLLKSLPPTSCPTGQHEDNGQCVPDSPSSPEPPTPAQCTADPDLEGCPSSPEPPTPAQCTADPDLEGCPSSPEPPTPLQCLADPDLEGCPSSPEPPTPAQCTADPDLEGCPSSPEPPTPAQCLADPDLEGCPPPPEPPTPAQCTADPDLEGCPPPPEQPTPAQCTADPDLEGCPPPIQAFNLIPPGEVTESQDCNIPNDYEACTNPSICEDDPNELGCPSEEECEENRNIIGCAFVFLGSSDKEKDKEDEEGSIPLEFIKLLLTFDQEINQGFKCNKVKLEDKNIVLCRDAGITQQQIVAQNPLNCPTQTENIPLIGTLEPQGLRLLADLDPCLIKDGSITLNMPNTEDIKIAVMYLDKTGNNHKGALINPKQIQALSNNQGLFKLDLDQFMMGKDPKTGEIITLTKINGLALYNNGESFIQFGPSNSIALTAIFALGQISGPYLPGNNIIDNPIIKSDSISQNPASPPPSPSPSPPPINTTDSSGISLSLLNLNTLDQNQLIDAISSKISQLRTFEKNKISQALLDLTQSTAAKGGDVMNSLRQIGTKILQNPSDPLVGKIIGLAQTK